MMNIQKMMKQAQQMQSKLAEVQAEMEVREVEGSAGGGAVRITLTGKGEMKKIVIDPSVVDASDKETLEDLILLAHRDAKANADSMLNDAMGAVTGGLNLPAGMKLPF